LYRYKKHLLSKDTTHFSRHANCQQEASKNIASHLLLNLPANEEVSTCLSADAFDSFTVDEPLIEEPELTIPEAPPQTHHRSLAAKNYVNNLNNSNGIMTMASYLARKLQYVNKIENFTKHLFIFLLFFQANKKL